MKMMFLLFAALVAAAAAAPFGDDHIVGGYECEPHSKPWQVSLRKWHHYCSGVLVQPDWVLSAAHCNRLKNVVGVYMGTNQRNKRDKFRQYSQIDKMIPHELYNASNFDNDIMLIKLAKPATINDYVKTIALPASCPITGSICSISGWGTTNSNTADRNRLQCLEVPVLSDDTCTRAYPGKITSTMFCAGFMEPGKDSCKGDSGGPMICNGELQGIISWGLKCAERDHPGVYTRVCDFNSWIANTIASN